MNQKEKNQIIEWLLGDRNFADGVAIYQRVGCNLRLKREFAYGETPLLAEVLAEQLMMLADVSKADLDRIKRGRDPQRPADPCYPPASEPVAKMIKFRDRYPFLRDENCPPALKVMVSDLFASYDRYTEAHRRLVEMPGDADNEVAYKECQEIVTSYLENRAIWKILEHYKETGEMPEEQKTEEDDLTGLTDLELASKFRSAVANESKRRKKVNDAISQGRKDEKSEEWLQYWSHRKECLKEEIEKRKKK